MMGKNVQINFKYTKKEFVNAMQQYFLRTSVMNVIISIVFIALSIILMNGVISTLYVVLLTLSVILLLMTGMINFIIPSIRYRKEPKYQTEYNLGFNDENIKFKTGDIDSTINWNYYKEAYENKDFYYLVFTKDAYSIIPKRAFTIQEDINEFRFLVESKLGKIKKK